MRKSKERALKRKAAKKLAARMKMIKRLSSVNASKGDKLLKLEVSF